MTVLNENGLVMRFFGRLTKGAFHNEQVIILALDMKDKPGYSKVITLQRIPVEFQEELKSIIKNPRCQKVAEGHLYEYLQTVSFSSGTTNASVFDTLRGLNAIKDIPQTDVVVECGRQRFATPQEILNEIASFEAQKKLTVATPEQALNKSIDSRENLMTTRLNEQDAKIQSVRDDVSEIKAMLMKVLAPQAQATPVVKPEPVVAPAPAPIKADPSESLTADPDYMSDWAPIRA